MGYTTIPDVEIVTAGIEWPASTGPVTITREHLADAVAAGNDDPHIRPGRVKIGHDNLQLCGPLGDHDPFWGGEPAFGSMANLRLENDGAVLVADLVEVPEWLAEAAPSAWPSRSMECVWDVTTEGDKRYSMVITAIALLGAHLPAVADLEDLQRLLAEGPDLERSQMATPTSASVNVDVVRRRFNFDWAMDPESAPELDTYWWWVREVRVDPDEIIADDDEGGLWAVPFSTDGEDEVTFGEPQRVRETFVPVNASVGAQMKRLGDLSGQKVAAAQLSRPDDKPAPANAAEDTPAAESQPNEQENTMDIDPAILRTRLGLADDASEEEINAALSADPNEEPEPEEPAEDRQTRESDPEPTEATQLPDGMVAVPADKWAEVQAGAQAGTELASKAEEKRRDDTIAAAIRKGKVPPADKDSLVNLHASNPEGFYRLLTAKVEDGGLSEGLVPVNAELGNGGDTSASADAYPDNWFPELREKPAGAVITE